MKPSLLLILIFACLPFGLLEARQTPAAPRPANPAPPARRNSAYNDAVAKARELARQKDFKAAATASEQAIQMDDKRWEGYVVAAEAYSGQQLYDDAIGMLEMALVRAPADKKPAVRDAISETRKLLAGPTSTAGASAASTVAGTAAGNVRSAAPAASAGAARAQQNLPQPPNPNGLTANDPSLEVTMQFIQEKLASQGVVAYRSRIDSPPSQAGGEPSIESTEVTEVSADAASCTLTTKTPWKVGFVVTTGDVVILLKEVEKVIVDTKENILNQSYLKQGSDLHVTISPVVFSINIISTKRVFKHHDVATVPGGKQLALGDVLTNYATFDFQDKDLANRVAKAFVHAVELCAPIQNPEPF
jgi:hypothetical protein